MPTIALDDFFAGVGIVSATCWPQNNASTAESGGGGVSRATYGTRLWAGEGLITPKDATALDEYEAKLAYLEESDVLFRVAPVSVLGLSASAGTVDAIGADRREVTLSAAVEPGGYFGTVFDTDKRSLHQVVSRASLVHTVIPPLPLGVVATDVASFGRVEINAVVLSVTPPSRRTLIASGASFTWRQTY